jgi:N-acylneuraminate cytidylyltransferase
MMDLPLLAYSIQVGLSVPEISKVCCTTDDPEIAEVAKKYGAEVPFLRPKLISGDYATDLEFLTHYLLWCQDNLPESSFPDAIVQLRPTYPKRSAALLKDCLAKFSQEDSADCLRTVIPCEKTPYKMYTMDNDLLVPLFSSVNGLDEPYNLPRQILPQCYQNNACIDIIRSSTILEKKSVTGSIMIPYLMDSSETYDLDTMDDWRKCVQVMTKD